MGIIRIYVGHCVGKYGPWYWTTPNILCRDRPAPARRCACPMQSILIKHESCLSVCLFVCSRFPKRPKVPGSWTLAGGLLWTNLKHVEARFSKFWFLRILWAFFVFFKMRFLVFFSKISAILTPRTMKFGHKDYFYTKKWHKKNFRKISFFKAFFRCFLNSQIQKWCVCSRFPQSLNIRAAWNLEFKSKLDQLEKKWKPFFKIRIFTPFYGNFSIFL